MRLRQTFSSSQFQLIESSKVLMVKSAVMVVGTFTTCSVRRLDLSTNATNRQEDRPRQSITT